MSYVIGHLKQKWSFKASGHSERFWNCAVVIGKIGYSRQVDMYTEMFWNCAVVMGTSGHLRQVDMHTERFWNLSLIHISEPTRRA